jgi:hypothetical protein
MNKSVFNNKLFQLLFVFTVLINCESNAHKNNSSKKPGKKVMIDTLNAIKEPEVILPKGNQIIHNSEKIYKLKWENGYILNTINISECDESNSGEGLLKFDKNIDSITFTNH